MDAIASAALLEEGLGHRLQSDTNKQELHMVHISLVHTSLEYLQDEACSVYDDCRTSIYRLSVSTI